MHKIQGDIWLKMEKETDVNEVVKAVEELASKAGGGVPREERRSKPSHYDMLGVEASAPQDLIKKAFREKALKFHPDKHANASPDERTLMEAKMKEISAAHSCLSDPDRLAGLQQ